MRLVAPVKITDDILRLCYDIDSTTVPVFVPVAPVTSVRHGYCLTDVPLFAEKNGGSIQFGWIIWECARLALEAEFHACWVNPENQLLDIVPKPDNEKSILFLPDSQRVYEHKPVPNKQRVLIDNDYTKRWLLTARKKNEIMAKHFKNDEVDAVAAATEFQNWVLSLSLGQPKIGRNDPCPCGSGLKHKRCCGR